MTNAEQRACHRARMTLDADLGRNEAPTVADATLRCRVRAPNCLGFAAEEGQQAWAYEAHLRSSRRAMVILCTSSGPSAMRIERPSRHIRAIGVSSDTPMAPCT